MKLRQSPLTFLLGLCLAQVGFAQTIQFKDVTEFAGLDYHHGYRVLAIQSLPEEDKTHILYIFCKM